MKRFTCSDCSVLISYTGDTITECPYCKPPTPEYWRAYKLFEYMPPRKETTG